MTPDHGIFAFIDFLLNPRRRLDWAADHADGFPVQFIPDMFDNSQGTCGKRMRKVIMRDTESDMN